MARTAEVDVNHRSDKTNKNNDVSHGSDVDMEQSLSSDKSMQSLNQSSDANHSKSSTGSADMKTNYEVYFVEVKTIGSVGRQPKSMQTAFTAMKTFKFNINWINEDEVLDKQWSESPDDYLFIVDTFGGKVFDYLSAKKLRIVSPLAVLYCYSKECTKTFRSIPIMPFPIFSQCMRRLFISLSGFDGHKKQEMVSKIRDMCGNFCKDFTKNVTHLVADTVRTKKYKVANERKVAVLSPLWLDECWNVSQHQLLSADDPTIVDRFRLKLFNKLLITVSQVEGDERKTIEKLVVDNGGQYSPSLKLYDPNSVLLLRTPDGDKFKYAQIRGVPCLDVQWLYDSHEKGYALPLEQYAVQPLSQKQANSQQLSPNKSKPSNDNEITANTLSQTTDKTTTDKTTESSSDEVINNNNNNDTNSDSMFSRLFADKSDEPFLEGCDFFIVGFDRPVFETIKSTLISSGSMVYNEFKNLVTHVIVGPKCVDTELDQFFAHKSCKVVSIEWLLECIRLNECCDCSPFELTKPKTIANSAAISSQTKAKPKEFFEGPLTVVCPKTTVKALAKWKEESKIDSKSNHKSLGDRLNNKNDVQWNAEEEEDMPSQKRYADDDNGDDEEVNRSKRRKR